MHKRIPRALGWIAGAMAAGVWLGAAAAAQELPKTHIKVVGSATYHYQYKVIEIPFFGKTMADRSGGRVTAELLAYDTVGLGGAEVLRLLKLGVLEFAQGGLIIVAGDDPALEGVDLAGMVLTLDTLKKTLAAYRPVIDRALRTKWNSKLLTLSPNPPQVFWCNATIKGIDDFKGLKIRVFGKTLADFVQGAGASAVTMPSSEVVQAMQRKLVDCAVTGSSNGNTAKWPEVTTHLYPVYAGWAPQFWAANLNIWNKLDAKAQKFIEEQMLDFEAQIWKLQGESAQQGVDCSTNRAPCTMPGLSTYKMTYVPITKADEQKIRTIVTKTVVPAWAKRCGKACVEEWNKTIGKVLDIKAAAGG